MTFHELKLGKVRTSKTEIVDIVKAWIVLSIAFGIVYANASILMGGSFTNLFSIKFVILFGVSLFTAGLGFLLHELAHKLMAQKYGCVAEFRADNQMLVFAMGLCLFLGVLFVAPGAVIISGMVTRRENGLISLVGPLTNYVLAAFFLLLHFILPLRIVGVPVFILGAGVNTMLGAFNMLPIWILDGKKVFSWNIPVWAIFMGIGVIGYLFFRGMLF